VTLWLTSHLESKGSNELDLFISDDRNKAYPITADKIVAEVVIGDVKNQIVFEPAPADERPKGEKGNVCSHYVAKAGFIKASDMLTCSATVPVSGKPEIVVWKDFGVKKFAHHDE